MNVPQNLKYSKSHEWVRVDGNIGTIGITDYAQHELGDIVFVEVETVGETLATEATFGTIEAVKTVSDLYMPLAGKVLEVNPALESAPESVNTSAYEEGWLVKIEISNPAELDALLSAEQYQALIEA